MQGDGGVGGTHFPQKEASVRRIVEPHRNYALFAVVRQIDRLRGLDNVVPVCGLDFLYQIGPRLQPGPHGDAVFPCHLLPDYGAARAGSSAQITKLERASGQGLMGDGIIFLNYYRVFRRVFKGNGVGLPSFAIDFLGVGLLNGEAGGRLQLLDFVPARFDALQQDFAV